MASEYFDIVATLSAQSPSQGKLFAVEQGFLVGVVNTKNLRPPLWGCPLRSGAQQLAGGAVKQDMLVLIVDADDAISHTVQNRIEEVVRPFQFHGAFLHSCFESLSRLLEFMLGALVVIDIGACAKPLDDDSLAVPHRH